MDSIGHELILGGAKSGKSRTAEERAAAWLAGPPRREALLLATALAGDDEMAQRIDRHRAARAARVPALGTVEVGRDLAAALHSHGAAHRLLVVDCLTLWLTQCLLPPLGPGLDEPAWLVREADLLAALTACPGPVVLVSNEIGLGVLPMSREARRCIDALGLLHQRVAAVCRRVTLMVAGQPLTVKEQR